MRRIGMSSCVTIAVVAVFTVVGCSGIGSAPAQEPGADDTGGTSVPDRAGSHSSPVIFSFTCETAAGRSTTYTTYDAVWAADRTDCTAHRLTGSEPSEQQRSAVDATGGTASLEQLASTCAVTGGEPWTGVITSAATARLADGLALYCPGHPGMDHLREALSAYRG